MKGWRAACKPNENVFFNLNKVTYFFNLPFNCHPNPLFEQTEIKNFIQFPDPIYDEISVPWWDNQMVIEELSIPFKTQHNSVILENVLSKNKERSLASFLLCWPIRACYFITNSESQYSTFSQKQGVIWLVKVMKNTSYPKKIDYCQTFPW